MKRRIVLVMVVAVVMANASGCMVARVLFDSTQRGCWSSAEHESPTSDAHAGGTPAPPLQ